MNLLVSDYDNTYELHYPNYDCLNIFKMNKVAIDKLMEKGNKFCRNKKTIDEKMILNHDGYTLKSVNPKIKKITKNIITNLSDLVYKIY